MSDPNTANQIKSNVIIILEENENSEKIEKDFLSTLKKFRVKPSKTIEIEIQKKIQVQETLNNSQKFEPRKRRDNFNVPIVKGEKKHKIVFKQIFVEKVEIEKANLQFHTTTKINDKSSKCCSCLVI